MTDLVVGDFQQKSHLHAASEPETHLVGETGDVVAADRNVRVFPAATLVVVGLLWAKRTVIPDAILKKKITAMPGTYRNHESVLQICNY